MKSALLPPAKHRSSRRYVRELRVGRTRRRRTETKTPCRPAGGKSKCRDDKNADRPIQLRLRESRGCPPERDEIEYRSEICSRKKAHRRQRERRLRPQNKDFPATNRLRNRVVPSIAQRTAGPLPAPFGENFWGWICGPGV